MHRGGGLFRCLPTLCRALNGGRPAVASSRLESHQLAGGSTAGVTAPDGPRQHRIRFKLQARWLQRSCHGQRTQQSNGSAATQTDGGVFLGILPPHDTSTIRPLVRRDLLCNHRPRFAYVQATKLAAESCSAAAPSAVHPATHLFKPLQPVILSSLRAPPASTWTCHQQEIFARAPLNAASPAPCAGMSSGQSDDSTARLAMQMADAASAAAKRAVAEAPPLSQVPSARGQKLPFASALVGLAHIFSGCKDEVTLSSLRRKWNAFAVSDQHRRCIVAVLHTHAGCRTQIGSLPPSPIRLRPASLSAPHLAGLPPPAAAYGKPQLTDHGAFLAARSRRAVSLLRLRFMPAINSPAHIPLVQLRGI